MFSLHLWFALYPCCTLSFSLLNFLHVVRGLSHLVDFSDVVSCSDLLALCLCPLYSIFALSGTAMESPFAATHVQFGTGDPEVLRRACIPASYPYDSAPITSSAAVSYCAWNMGESLYTNFHMMLTGQPSWMPWGPCGAEW